MSRVDKACILHIEDGIGNVVPFASYIIIGVKPNLVLFFLFIDIEAWKYIPSLTSHNSPNTLSPVQSHGIVDQASIDYGVMMTKLTEILENCENSLKRMKTAFVHMVHHMEHEVYTNIIQSEKYRAVVSVETFFELLAPYLKSPDCSLLKALVCATNCERAIQRLEKYLDKSRNLVLDDSSPPDNAPESEMENESVTVITSEPIAADFSAVPITARMSVAEVSWGMLRHAQSLLGGLFRVPQFALQYSDEVESASVIIKWTTSMKIAVHMQSVLLDDGDLKLLLQERIVSVHVGMDYKISVGNQEYWRMSHSWTMDVVIIYIVKSMHEYMVLITHIDCKHQSYVPIAHYKFCGYTKMREPYIFLF